MANCATYTAWVDMECMCPFGTYAIATTATFSTLHCTKCPNGQSTFVLGATRVDHCRVFSYESKVSGIIILLVFMMVMGLTVKYMKNKNSSLMDTIISPGARLVIGFLHFVCMCLAIDFMNTQYRVLDKWGYPHLPLYSELCVYVLVLMITASFLMYFSQIYDDYDDEGCEGVVQAVASIGYYTLSFYELIIDIISFILFIIYFFVDYIQVVVDPNTGHELDYATEVLPQMYQPTTPWAFILWLLLMIMYNLICLDYIKYEVFQEEVSDLLAEYYNNKDLKENKHMFDAVVLTQQAKTEEERQGETTMEMKTVPNHINSVPNHINSVRVEPHIHIRSDLMSQVSSSSEPHIHIRGDHMSQVSSIPEPISVPTIELDSKILKNYISKDDMDKIYAKTLIPYGRFAYFIHPTEYSRKSIKDPTFMRKFAAGRVKL